MHSCPGSPGIYSSESRLPCVSTPRRSWCSVLILLSSRVLFCFVFLLVLCLLFGLFAFPLKKSFFFFFF